MCTHAYTHVCACTHVNACAYTCAHAFPAQLTSLAAPSASWPGPAEGPLLTFAVLTVAWVSPGHCCSWGSSGLSPHAEDSTASPLALPARPTRPGAPGHTLHLALPRLGPSSVPSLPSGVCELAAEIPTSRCGPFWTTDQVWLWVAAPQAHLCGWGSDAHFTSCSEGDVRRHGVCHTQVQLFPTPTPLLFPSSPPRPAWGVALTPSLPLQRCDLGMSLVTRGSRMRGAAPSQQVGAVADGPGPRSPSVRWAQGPHAPDAACCCRPGSLRPLRHPPPPPPLLLSSRCHISSGASPSHSAPSRLRHLAQVAGSPAPAATQRAVGPADLPSLLSLRAGARAPSAPG